MAHIIKSNHKRLLTLFVLGLIVVLISISAFADGGQKAAEELRAKGIISGDEKGDFMLEKYLSRSELAIILSRLSGLETEAKTYPYEPSFKDGAQLPSWAKSYIAYAQYKAWMFGDDEGKFMPDQSLTGEEMATILLRLLGYEKFQWTQNAKVLKQHTGVEIKNSLKPITRAEVFEALWQAISQPVMKDGKIFLDKRNEMLSAPTSNLQLQYNKALAATKLVIINADKYLMTGFSDGLATVTGLSDPATGEEATGFINKDGTKVIEPDPMYQGKKMRLNTFRDGRAWILKNGKYGFINTKGEIVIDPIYDDVSAFSEGLAYVKKGETWAYIDRDGKVAFEGPKGYSAGSCTYMVSQNTIYDFHEGLVFVEDENRNIAYLNKKGEFVIPVSKNYEKGFYFVDDRTTVMKQVDGEQKLGLIDNKGKMIVEPSYSGLSPYSEGLAKVIQGPYDQAKYGYIDKEGREVIKPQYKDGYDFHHGYAFVLSRENEGGFIDKTGKEASPFNYEYGFAFGKGFMVKKNGLFAYVGLDRHPITGYIFSSARERSDNYVQVKINNKFGLMDKNGDIVVDIKYERIINSEEDEDCFVLKDGESYYIVDLDID